MQNKLWTVLKIQFLGQFGLNELRYGKDKKRRNASAAMLAVMIFIAVIVVGMSFMIGIGYGAMGMMEVLPGIALAAVSMITFFFSILKANAYLFAFQEYDMLMSLPLSVKTVISSKFLYMYLNNLLFSLGVMLPMGSAYLMWAGVHSVAEAGLLIFMWLAAALFAPLIPMTAASILGAFVAAVVSKFRFKVVIQVVLILALMCCFFAFNIFLNTAGSDEEIFQRMEDVADVTKGIVYRFYPVTILFDTAVNRHKILPFLGFVVLSYGIYYLFIVIVERKYCAINTALMSKGKRVIYHMKKQKGHTVLGALVYKEWRRFISSAPYVINIGIGMLFAVLLSVGSMVIGRDALEEDAELMEIVQFCQYVIPFFITMLLSMTCTTSVSLSLEGKNLWILQSLPVDWKMILRGKMAFNMVLLLPAAFVCSVCLWITLQFDILTFLLYLLLSFAMISFSTVIGMWFNLCFQKYQWENETEVLKQSASGTLGILVNMFLEIILMLAALVFSVAIDGRIILLAMSVVFSLISGVIYYILLSGETSKIKMPD